MAKKIIIGIVLLLIVASAVILISAISYGYSNKNEGNQQEYNEVQINNIYSYDNQGYKPADKAEIKEDSRPQCYNDKGQYQPDNILYVNEYKESVCYDTLGNSKGPGECIGTLQEKKLCYKQVESCSGTKTVSIDCYPEIEQEKGYGECLNLPQEKAQCYKVKEYKSCY